MITSTPLNGLARVLALLAGAAILGQTASAQVPTMLSYQGRVQVNGTNFTGTGQFKFALVQGAGPSLLWKSDGSPGNAEPAAAVSLPVVNGLVMVLLGDTTLAGMTALPPAAFNQNDVRLRVWFNGGLGSQQLTPDQRLVSVGYAFMAGNVPDGSITAAKLGAGVLNPTNFPANSVGSTQLADTIALGTSNTVGRLDVYRTGAGTPSISLLGSLSQISTYGSDGLEQSRLWGSTYGELLLNNSLANNATAVRLTAQGSTGGMLSLRNTNGLDRALLEGENTGGLLTLYTADGNIGAVLYGNEGSGSGALSLRNTNGNPRFRAYGGPLAGSLGIYDTDATETVSLVADPNGALTLRQGDGSTGATVVSDNGTGGGAINIYRDNGTFAAQLTIADETRRDGFLGLCRSNSTSFGVLARGAGVDGGGFLGLYQADGTETVSIQSTESGSGGGQMLFRNGAGTAVTLELDGQIGTTGGGFVGVRDVNGSTVIELNGDNGTVRAQVIEITGGSDLSEKFEIAADKVEVQPGMLVCIDPENPGRLLPSARAYDRTAAGVVSGAGGVLPGMLMGQKGTLADGRHPVALTGRVYARVDADAAGPIQPGDLITTSDTPGHGMKVKDHARAQGAIIGKAMTGLKSGKGLVLVLVSLQ